MDDPSDYGSADTKHQTPKQDSSNTEKIDRAPLSQVFGTQNTTRPLFSSASFTTFYGLLDHDDSGDDKNHAVLDHNPNHKFDWNKFNDAAKAAAEAIRAKPEPATEKEAEPIFTFGQPKPATENETRPMFKIAQPKPATGKVAVPMFTFARPKPDTKQEARPMVFHFGQTTDSDTEDEAKSMFTIPTKQQGLPIFSGPAKQQGPFTIPTGQQGLFTIPTKQQDLPKAKVTNDSRPMGCMQFLQGIVSNERQAFNFQEPAMVSAFSDIPVEEYPKSRFFSLNFQSSLFLGLQLAKDSATLMEELLAHQESNAYAMDSSQINCQLTQMKKAGELKNFFNTETIAFWGSSLAGKSSVINSLLDFPRLAAADDFGSAVTSIVTEYKQMKPAQTERIKVEVDFLCGAALEDHINELLWSFRRQFLDAKDSLSTDDMKECREAGSALQSAFGSERGYNRQFMTDKSEGAFERILDQLIKWTKTIPWPTGASDGKWVTNAKTAEEFHTKTSLFMQDRIWPFTRIMRVYIDAPILRAGLVIADSPGLGDTNFARVKAATTYLSSCDLIFHVTDIRRALTDERLKSSIQKASSHNASTSRKGSTKKWPCTAIICTMADVIDEFGADRYLQNSGSVKILEAMERIEDDIRKVDTTKDPVLATELQWKKKMLFIEARNNRVENGLKKEYESAQEDLKVFSVSNLFYDSRLQEAKNFLLTTLPSALASISLRSQSLEVGPTCSMRNIMDEVNLTKWGFCQISKEVKKTFIKSIAKIGKGWQLALVDYQAFCLKGGRHVDEFNEAVDWNTELISQMRSDLTEKWNDLERDLPATSLDIDELIKRRLRALKARLMTDNFPSLMVESLKHRMQDTTQFIETVWSKFESRMRGLRAKTLESNDGPGKAKALRAKAQGQIDNGSLFPNIISAMSNGVKEASNRTFDELKAMIVDSIIASIIGDIHSVYSTITLAKKPIKECDGQTAKEESSLEMLRIKCRGLDNRYEWIMKQIE
ncbi:hypothetical protein N7513_002390 [Penicillium frequentans]|nr:hypothetical protein N7513_002390 [Penicillium glabrum]